TSGCRQSLPHDNHSSRSPYSVWFAGLVIRERFPPDLSSRGGQSLHRYAGNGLATLAAVLSPVQCYSHQPHSCSSPSFFHPTDERLTSYLDCFGNGFLTEVVVIGC